MLSLTGILGRGRATADAIYAPKVRACSSLQLLSFLVALGFTISFGLSVG
jgi:hypothetical protein